MSGNRPSLAGAFAPATQRGSKLEGMLAPKRKTAGEGLPVNDASEPKTFAPLTAVPAVAPEPAPEADAAPVDGSSVKEFAPATASSSPSRAATQTSGSAPAKARTKASNTVPGAPRNVGVYLEPGLLAEVKEAVHLQRITYADLLIDAFEALDDAELARTFTAETVLTSSGMPRRAVRRRGAAGIQIQVRLDDEQIAWLDQKVVEFDAPSRSALVSAAYRLHLTKSDASEQ